MINVMLDTCILMDFLLIAEKKKNNQPIPERLVLSSKIYEFILQKKIKNFMTLWNVLEYRDVVEKFWHEKILLLEGYHPSEFGEAKADFPLSGIQLNEINNIIEDISKVSELVRVQINDSYKQSLINLGTIGIETFDAIHVMESVAIPDCYFVTRDNKLYDKVERILLNMLKKNIKIIKTKELIHIVEQNSQ